MKTTIDIPEAILEETLRITGKPTKKEAVVTVLTDYVRRHKLDSLVGKLGTFDGVISSDELASLREQS